MTHCTHMLPPGLQPIGYWPVRVALYCCNCGLTKHRVERVVKPDPHGPYLNHAEYAIWPGDDPFKGDVCPGDTAKRTEANIAQEAVQEAQVPAVRVPARKKRSAGKGGEPMRDSDSGDMYRLRERSAPRDS